MKKITHIILWSALAVNLCHAEQAVTQSPVSYPAYPAIQYKNDEQSKLIQRGEYLVKAGDCIACHTDTTRNGPAFAGGLPIRTPFGTFYTPNITPDKTTGIGNWSNDDFLRAMQLGIRPDGQYYFPVFPYPNFSKVTKSDILAIKAYLFSLPAVKKPNLANDVPFPFNWRFLQLGWRTLFFHPGEYKYDASHSQVWNRGAYLVQGLGHCGMCHTPMNFLGAAKEQYFLTGNFVDGYYAPNITSAGLKGFNLTEITDVFTQDKMLRGAGVVQGPMADVNHDSLKYLSLEDLQAIARYLQTVKSAEPTVSAGGPIGADTGKKIYAAHCAVCHDSGAAGAPRMGDQKAWEPRLKQGMDIIFQHALNGLNSMPPKGGCMSCSDDEIKAAAQYLVDQGKNGKAALAPPASIVLPPKPTIEDGKKIYAATCSICHDEGKLGAPKIGDMPAWDPRIKQGIDILFTHAIVGFKQHPPKGACMTCTNAEIQAAVLYMVQQSKSDGDYFLWSK